MDGYVESDEDHSSPSGSQNGNTEDEDAPENSLLRMGANLLAAARSNPVPGSNQRQTPKVCIRLTRLVPDESEPRISETIQQLREMGIEDGDEA